MKPRRCNVCTGVLRTRPPHDDRGHNCVSLASLLTGPPPEQCWLVSSSPLDQDLVRAVATTRRNDRAATRLQRAIVRAAAAIRSAPRLDDGTDRALRAVTGRHLVSVRRHMIRNLPESSPLSRFLRRMPKAAAKGAHTIAGAVKAVADCADDVGPEFHRALEGYLRASTRRYQVKRARGHSYSEYTVYRRLLIAVDFCRFLVESQSVETWLQVMPRHLDAYCAARSSAQGRRVYPFLAYAQGVTALTAKLRSPRHRGRSTLEFAPSFEAQERAVAALLAAPDDEAVVVGLFVAVYAQRITDCCRLHLSNFRLRGDRLQARFAEAWIPLDRAVAKRVLSIAPDVAQGVRSEDRTLFPLDPRGYSKRIRRICGLPIKPLRLGALAAVIRRGATDRASLHLLFGVSTGTIENVERLMEWDLQWTVDPEIVAHRNRIIRGEA